MVHVARTRYSLKGNGYDSGRMELLNLSSYRLKEIYIVHLTYWTLRVLYLNVFHNGMYIAMYTDTQRRHPEGKVLM